MNATPNKTDLVTVSGIGGTFEVIEGPNSRGEYLLARGALTLWVASGRITIAPGARKKTKKKEKKTYSEREPDSTLPESPSARIMKLDLHGARTAEVEERFQKALNEALIAGFDQIKIVHGIGTGAVEKTLYALLPRFSQVRRFGKDPKNRGVTLVYL